VLSFLLSLLHKHTQITIPKLLDKKFRYFLIKRRGILINSKDGQPSEAYYERNSYPDRLWAGGGIAPDIGRTKKPPA
jgi:hypothetical protein